MSLLEVKKNYLIYLILIEKQYHSQLEWVYGSLKKMGLSSSDEIKSTNLNRTSLWEFEKKWFIEFGYNEFIEFRKSGFIEFR